MGEVREAVKELVRTSKTDKTYNVEVKTEHGWIVLEPFLETQMKANVIAGLTEGIFEQLARKEMLESFLEFKWKRFLEDQDAEIVEEQAA